MSVQEPASGQALATIVRGMAVALLGSMLGGGLGLVFSVVMARVMSQPEFGLLVLALNFANTGSQLGTAGADYAAIRYVAAAETPGAKRGAMVTPLALAAALNGASAVPLFVFAHPIAVHLLGQPAFTNPLRALALVLPLTVMAQMLSAAVSGLEQARGELVRKVAEQSGRIVLAPLGFAIVGVVGAVLGMAVAAALAIAAVGAILLRSLPRGGRTEPISVRDVVSFSWPQTVANAAGQVWWLVAVIALARSTSARDVALFGAAAAIARAPALIYNAFSYRFSPTISRLWARQQLAELADLLRGVTRWVSICSVPLYAVAIALPGPLLQIYGMRYSDGALPLALISLGVMIDSVAGPVDRALIMTGRVKLEMTANVVTSGGLIPVVIVFTALWGLTGSAVSVVLYNLLLNVVKTYLVRRTLGMSPLSRALFGPFAAALVAGAAAAALDHFTSLGDSLPGTALLVAVLLAVYTVLLLRVVGVSKADRDSLRLALRPAR